MGENVENLNTMLSFLIISKLDKETEREWHRTRRGNKVPKYEEILTFLREQATLLTCMRPSAGSHSSPTASYSQVTSRNGGDKGQNGAKIHSMLTTTISQMCSYCNEQDFVEKCEKFLMLSVPDRMQVARKAQLRLGCLKRGHKTRLCEGPTCRTCNKRHNTLLHLSEVELSTWRSKSRPNASSTSEVPAVTALVSSFPTRDLIVTARIHVSDNLANAIEGRAILCTGSSSNFMTEEFARKLKLPLKRFELPIQSMANANSKTNHVVTATINSRLTGFTKTLTFLTVLRIGQLFPAEAVNRSDLKIPQGLQLADPCFDQPAPVDLLLNSSTTLALLCQGQIQLNDDKNPDIVLQQTRLGWIVGGSTLSAYPSINRQPRQNFLSSVEKQLKNFWEMDDINTEKHWSKEEHECEEKFKEGTPRDATGRYIVALPFNEKKEQIGKSRELARNRFYTLLRKFKRNPELDKQYSAVMQEYIDLGHMSPVHEEDQTEGFYLPHHAVIKTTSLTTNVRVVFDASARGADGIPLNEALLVGPTIQADIFSLLVRFFTHQYVLTGDIEKMYRQFLVKEKDRKYQRIWWRDEKGEKKVFQLNTVTFGVSSALYLAIRCLHQLADDEAHHFPEAAKIIKRDLYVDDLLTGTDDFDEAWRLRNDITALLERGQLNLRQWASNDPALLKGLPDDSVNLGLKTSNDSTIKTLGLHWNSANTIVYTVQPIPMTRKITKKIMLSKVSKIFDPLGLLGRVIVKGRMILHRLWLEKLGWDEPVPFSVLTDWKTYISQLSDLNNFSFDHKIIISKAINLELHGFCDASEKGYGACIYVRSIDSHRNIQVRLLCSKYRVAPIKPVSLPRSELCAALLLADLYTAAKQALIHKIHQVTLWSDSMVTLHWIKTSPHKLLVFVANRVTGIQKKTEGIKWRHVRTKDNPADHISRGLFPKEFIGIDNWKHGPHWLGEPREAWPVSELTIPPEIPEIRQTQCLLTDTEWGATIEARNTEEQPENPYILRYSSIGHLRRLFAIGLRFKNKSKGPISAQELTAADDQIIKVVQYSTFFEVIKILKKDQVLPGNHKWKNLSLFLDKNGMVRVGGRLKHAQISYNQKYPVLTPKGHHISHLLITNEHITNCHAGAQTALYALRRKYWLIDGRHQVRKIINSCVTCRRAHPPTIEYIMSDMPKIRVTEAKPFQNVGVDDGGPFYIKERKFRNRAKIKAWVAVFATSSSGPKNHHINSIKTRWKTTKE